MKARALKEIVDTLTNNGYELTEIKPHLRKECENNITNNYLTGSMHIGIIPIKGDVEGENNVSN